MKKIYLLFIISVLPLIMSCERVETLSVTTVKIYCVDAQLNRLIPYKREVVGNTNDDVAKNAIQMLAAGDDSNDRIRRLLPDDECINVEVRGNIAYVDLDINAADAMPENRDIEKLLIYQIVNTLTDIKGIRFVKFTVNGKEKKDFMGFYDMRETYKHRYPE